MHSQPPAGATEPLPLNASIRSPRQLTTTLRKTKRISRKASKPPRRSVVADHESRWFHPFEIHPFSLHRRGWNTHSSRNPWVRTEALLTRDTKAQEAANMVVAIQREREGKPAPSGRHVAPAQKLLPAVTQLTAQRVWVVPNGILGQLALRDVLGSLRLAMFDYL
jgi:hypothetical protein